MGVNSGVVDPSGLGFESWLRTNTSYVNLLSFLCMNGECDYIHLIGLFE